MTKKKEEIEFDGDELEAAQAWHGGIASMLYAIASTGSLRKGSIRPSKYHDCEDVDTCKVCQGVHYKRVDMTDEEWWDDLCGRLADEAEQAATLSDEDDDDKAEDEEGDYTEQLLSIAKKAREAMYVKEATNE